MKKCIAFIALVFAMGPALKAQMETVVSGEIGVTGGAAHYFGDLNPTARLNRPKIAVGAFYRKPFGDYAAIRLTFNYAQLGYSDIYSNNEYQRRRNLSFNTNIFEVALRGDFNFFKYDPTDIFHSFTPYATLGVGFFSYNPYAYLKGQKYYLRPLHTEGQTIVKGRKEYGTMAMCIPIGFGLKYAANQQVNISFEIAYRFTSTDYIDDVSTTYVGINNFPAGSVASLLQDRSYETGTPIGVAGKQRGFSTQNDSYIMAQLGISLNIFAYHCPTVN
ncbi:MAG: hypothetical protein KGM98_15350 [Bacteroidota bacterium]|nr:hypothetical protein [Bacteroidota bacterium]